MTKLQRVNEAIKWIYFEGLAINQADLSDKLGYTASSFSQIVNGKVNLSDSFINKLSKFAPKLNKAWLLNGQGEMLSPVQNGTYIPNINEVAYVNEAEMLYDLEATFEHFEVEPQTITNSHGNTFTFYPDNRIYIEVPKIPFPAHATYLEVFQDEAAIKEEFNTITFKVDKFGLGYYLAFEVVGDSMNGGSLNDTPSGAEVLAREVGRHLWSTGFRKTDYGFILITKSGIYHKDIGEYNDKTGMLTLNSRNEMHPTKQYPINDIYQIFHIIKRSF